MRSSHNVARGLDLVLRPGVAPLVAVLAQHGEVSIRQLRRNAGGELSETVILPALRSLAAHGMVRSVAGGSWDDDCPEAFVQLTPQGAEFAAAVRRLAEFIAEQLPQRPSLTRP